MIEGLQFYIPLGTEGHNDKVELRGEVDDLDRVHNNVDTLTCLSHSRCANKGESGCSGGHERWVRAREFQYTKEDEIWNPNMALPTL
jgi:hypothetical protein